MGKECCSRLSRRLWGGTKYELPEKRLVGGYCLFIQNADLLSVLVMYEHIPPKVDLDY